MSGFGDLDVTGMQSFKRGLDDLQAKAPAFFEDCIRELAEDLLARTEARTPSSEGVLRRSWRLGAVRKAGSAYQIEILNPQPNASQIEYGYHAGGSLGWVGGRFMLTISAAELEARMPGLLDRRLEHYMRQLRW